MRSALITLILFSIVTEQSCEQVESNCHANESHPYLFFGTKTSYERVRGAEESTSNCKPIQFWSLIRHGTRLPCNPAIEKMKQAINLHNKLLSNYATSPSPGLSRLCLDDFQALSQWKWDESIESQGYILTTEGQREIRQLARRFKIKYPTLFSNYSQDQYYFRHTKKQRTWASCLSYIDELFGSSENVTIVEPQMFDPVLEPYKNCSSWIKKVDSNDYSYEKEFIIFRQQPGYIKLLDSVSLRLGFNETLPNIDVLVWVIYNLCRFETARKPKNISPWCSLFSKPELLLMEYYEDLLMYYKCGYGNEFHKKLGCMPIKFMVEVFENTIASKQAKPRVLTLFTHDVTLNLVFTVLGYGRDRKPLTGRDYDDLLVNRKSRSSLNLPFAANIAAILHECDDDNYQVQFFLNERHMELENCPQGLCSWNYLKKFLFFTKDCNFDFCTITNASTINPSSGL